MFISLQNTDDDKHLINLNQVQTITLLKRKYQNEDYTQLKFKFADRETHINTKDAQAIYEDLVRKLTQAN